ncbi:hypothetical protein GCM10025883_05130 [Mobilicoccus caccae]|uniref:Uncharacterized protein n=1 Tax=Mobilicoccus caccae TaxID=1859295 RepID=A0ABQ6IKK2_9MICO|nr:hypothetical protein GCM10025883_05130 [Mobilicoccus caccae]
MSHTRIGSPLSSRRSASEAYRSAALTPQYPAPFSYAPSAAMEVTVTIDPPPPARSAGINALVTATMPMTFVSYI